MGEDGIYMSNESDYISSALLPVQLHSNVPKPLALDAYSKVYLLEATRVPFM